MSTRPSASTVSATPAATDGVQPRRALPLDIRTTPPVVAASSPPTSPWPLCNRSCPAVSTSTHVTRHREGHGTEVRRVDSRVAAPAAAAHAPTPKSLASCGPPSSPPSSLLLLLLLCSRKGSVSPRVTGASWRAPSSPSFRADMCPPWLRLCGARLPACVTYAAAAGTISTIPTTTTTTTASTAAATVCRTDCPAAATAALHETPLPTPSSHLVAWRGSPRVRVPLVLCRPYSTAAPPPPPTVTPGAAVVPQSVLDLSDPTGYADAAAYSSVSVVTAGAPWSREKDGAGDRRERRTEDEARHPRSKASAKTPSSSYSSAALHPRSAQQLPPPQQQRMSGKDGRKRTGPSRGGRQSSDARAASDAVQTTWGGASAQTRSGTQRRELERKKPDAGPPQPQQRRQGRKATTSSSAAGAAYADGAHSANDSRDSIDAAVAGMNAAAPLSTPSPTVVPGVHTNDGPQSDAALRRLLAMHSTFASNYTTMQSDEKVAVSLERLCAEALAHSRVLEEVVHAMRPDLSNAAHNADAATTAAAADAGTVRLRLTSSATPSAPPVTLAVLEVRPAVVQWLDEGVALPPLRVREIATCLDELQQRAAAAVTGGPPAHGAEGAAAPPGTSHAAEDANPVLDLWYETWGRQHRTDDVTARGSTVSADAQAAGGTAAATMDRWQRTQSRLHDVLLAHFTGHGDASRGPAPATAKAPSSRFRSSSGRAANAAGTAEETPATSSGAAMDGGVRGLLPYLSNLLATLCLVKRGRLTQQFRADAARVFKTPTSRGGAASDAPAGSYAHLCHVAQRVHARADAAAHGNDALAVSPVAAAELRTAAQQYLRSISLVDAVHPTVDGSGGADAPSCAVAVLDVCIGLLLRVLVFYFPVLSPKLQSDLLTSLMEPWLRQRQDLGLGEGGEEVEERTGGGGAVRCPCAPAAWRALLGVHRILQGICAGRGGGNVGGSSSGDGLVPSSALRDELEETLQLVQSLHTLCHATVLDAETRVVQRVLALAAPDRTPGSRAADAPTSAASPAQLRGRRLMPMWPEAVYVMCATRAQQLFGCKLLTLVFAALAGATVPLTGATAASLSSRRLEYSSEPRTIDLTPLIVPIVTMDDTTRHRVGWSLSPGVAAPSQHYFADDELPAGPLRTLVRQHSACPYTASRLLLYFLTPLLHSLQLLTFRAFPGQRMLLAELMRNSLADPVVSVLRLMPPLPVPPVKLAGVHDTGDDGRVDADTMDAGAVLAGVAARVPPSAARTWHAVAPVMALLRECALPALWAVLWEKMSARLQRLSGVTAAHIPEMRAKRPVNLVQLEKKVHRLAGLGALCAWLTEMAPEAERQAQRRLSASNDTACVESLAVLREARVAASFAQCVRDTLTTWTQRGVPASAGELLLAHFKTEGASAAAALVDAAAPAQLQGGADGATSTSRNTPSADDADDAAAPNAAEWAMLVELATAAQSHIWSAALRDEVAEWVRKTALVEGTQAPALSPAAVPVTALPAAAVTAAVTAAAAAPSSQGADGALEPASPAAVAAAATAAAATRLSTSPPPGMDGTLLRWWRGVTGADLGLAAAPVLLPEVWATLSRLVRARAAAPTRGGEGLFTAEEVVVIVRQLSRIATRNVITVLLQERAESSTAAGRRTASTSDGSLIMEALRRIALLAAPVAPAVAAEGDAAASAAPAPAPRTDSSSSSCGSAHAAHREDTVTSAELVDQVEAALLDSLAAHLPALPAMTVVEAAWLRLCSLSTVSGLILQHTQEDADSDGARAGAAAAAAAAAAPNCEQPERVADALAIPAAVEAPMTSAIGRASPMQHLRGTLRDAPTAWLRALHEAVTTSPHACHVAGAFAHTFYRLLRPPPARGGDCEGPGGATPSTAVLHAFTARLHASCAEAIALHYATSPVDGDAATAEEAVRTSESGSGDGAVPAQGAAPATTHAPTHGGGAEGCGGSAASSSSPGAAAALEDARAAAALPSRTTPREAHGRLYVHVRVLTTELHRRLPATPSGAPHDAVDDVWTLYASLLKAAEALLAYADMGNAVDALQLVAVVSVRMPWPQASTERSRSSSGSRTDRGAGAQEAGNAASERAARAAPTQQTGIDEPHGGDGEAVTSQLHERFRSFVLRVMPRVDGLVVEQVKRDVPHVLTVALLASSRAAVERVLRHGGSTAVLDAATAAATATTAAPRPSLAATQPSLWQRVPLASMLQRAAQERLASWQDAQLLSALFANAPEVAAALPSMAPHVRDFRAQLPWRGVDAAFKAIAVAAADAQHRGEADGLRRDGDGRALLSYASSPSSPASSAAGAGREARGHGAERARRAGGSGSGSSSTTAVSLAVPASLSAGAAAVRVGELRHAVGDDGHPRTVPVFRSAAAVHGSRAAPSVLRQAWGAFAKRLLQEEGDPALGDAALWVAALYSGAVAGCAGTQLFESLLASLVFGVDAGTGAPRIRGLDVAGWTLLLQACAAPSGQQRHRQTHQSLLEDAFLEFVDGITADALEAARTGMGAGELAVSGPERCAFVESIPQLLLADTAVWLRVRRCVEAWVAALDAHSPAPASAPPSSTEASRREWAVQWQRSFNWAVRFGGHGALAFAETWCDAAAAAERAEAVEWMQTQLLPLVESGDGSHNASH